MTERVTFQKGVEEVAEGKRKKGKYEAWETDSGIRQIKAWISEGLTDSKIAERMNVNKSQLSRWRRTRPIIRDALARMITVDGRKMDAHDMNTGGPKRKLTNVAEVRERVNAWIEKCKKENIVLTVSGICLELNISKSTFNEYIQRKDDKSEIYERSEIDGEMHPISVYDVLKRAKLAIENDIEQRMLANKCNVAGAIFDLKNNHGYADKSEINTVNTNKREIADDDLDKRIKELLNKSESTKDNVIDFKQTV